MKTKIELIDISEIKENPNNPRIIKDQKFKDLVRSVKKFPEMLEIRPIVINAEMIVLGGNMRLRACIEAGIKQVPIIRAEHLTEDQQREFLIKDNVSGGEWNWDVLANEWDAAQLTEWGLDFLTENYIENIDDKEKFIQNENQFLITIECQNENEQQMLYDEFENRGLKCKLIM